MLLGPRLSVAAGLPEEPVVEAPPSLTIARFGDGNEWRVVAEQLAAELTEEIEHSYLGDAAETVKHNSRALAHFRRLRAKEDD